MSHSSGVIFDQIEAGIRRMTTADVVEACIDSLQGDVVNEYLQQYADILRQTTEGTDALVSDLSEEANIVHCYEEMTNLCRTFEAENARLKAAMDKYLEDEVLGKLRGELLLRCCIEICQEESTDNGTAQKIEARIRALEEKK